MRASQIFFPTLKENPKDAQIASHRLMIRAGLVRQTASGLYTWLPMGVRVLRRIEAVIRAEMEHLGASEFLFPLLQKTDLWQQSGRLESYGPELMRFADRHDAGLLLSPTAEEVFTDLFSREIKSYKALPLHWYQMHWKFRDEIRPRFGVMRAREFLMFDDYSFASDAAGGLREYQKVFLAFCRIFRTLGLSVAITRAETGEIGGDLSHEFHVLAETGESTLYVNEDSLGGEAKLASIAYTEAEKVAGFFEEQTQKYYTREENLHNADDVPADQKDKIVERKGIEVGHIFSFGTKYSAPLGAKVKGPDGRDTDVYMGSYGLGIGRIVAATIEAHHDEKGIIWPRHIAPFTIAVVPTQPEEAEQVRVVQLVEMSLEKQGINILVDDRPLRWGEKLADMELLGIPMLLIVGKDYREKVELKNRVTGEMLDLPLSQIQTIGEMLRSLDILEALPDDFNPKDLEERLRSIDHLRAQSEMEEIKEHFNDPRVRAEIEEALADPALSDEERRTLTDLQNLLAAPKPAAEKKPKKKSTIKQ